MHSNLLITLRAVIHGHFSILYTVAKEIAQLLMFDVGTHLCLLLDTTYATTFHLIIVGWWHTISWFHTFTGNMSGNGA